MSEKPGKRLVSKGKYVWVISAKTALGSMSLLCYIVGGITLLFVVAMLWFGVRSDVVLSGLGLPLCLISTILLAVAYSLSKTKKSIDSVTPITRNTVGLIPAKEILVRPTDQPAELLRAAPQGSETPPEELLRATLKGTHDEDR